MVAWEGCDVCGVAGGNANAAASRVRNVVTGPGRPIPVVGAVDHRFACRTDVFSRVAASHSAVDEGRPLVPMP